MGNRVEIRGREVSIPILPGRSREFPRLAIYTKSRAEGPAFGVYRESWEFRWKRNSPGSGFEDMSSCLISALSVTDLHFS